MPDPTDDTTPERTVRVALLRGALGILQMAFAVGSLVLLATTGVNRVSLIAVVVTSILTGVSISLFGARPRPPRKDGR